MRYQTIDPQLFSKNREKLFKVLDNNSCAVVISADLMPRNGDLFYSYRQNSDFFYLTGIEQEKSKVLFVKQNGISRTILFIIEPNEKMEIWEGKKLSFDDAANISEIDEIRYIDEFDSFFENIVKDIKTIYVNKNENPRFVSTVQTGDIQLNLHLEQKFTDCSFKSLASILKVLRVVKEPEEIALMSKACDITKNAFIRVLNTTKPGMKEYEVEAELTYEFMKSGAGGHAYEPIVASGENSCFLHYTKNDKTLEEGEILFLDFGAEYGNYSSDCSRAIPVSGKFTERQTEVYEAVLRVLRKASALIVPGTTILKYHKKVCNFIEEECINLGLFTKEDVKKQDPKLPLYFRYFMHGTSHFMGLDTHDVGDKDMILKPGMVVSCEPGIYIPEEKLGIRLENDILVTEDGNVDLMADLPIEVADIELLMAK